MYEVSKKRGEGRKGREEGGGKEGKERGKGILCCLGFEEGDFCLICGNWKEQKRSINADREATTIKTLKREETGKSKERAERPTPML
jgi:hypothetical protein